MVRHSLVIFLFLNLIGTASVSLPAQSAAPEQATEPVKKQATKPYKFTDDWFSGNIPLWTEVLAPFKGKPDIHYLEIGVWEGRSAIWVLENILTHPTSTLTGIDVFPQNLKETYLENLRISGHPEKAVTLTGLSQIELRRLKPDSYNIIYVDGGHTADMVLADAVLCWDLLKVGGVIIFDDYRWGREYPDEIRPGMAVDAFLTAFRNHVEVVHHGYQVMVRKKEGPPRFDPNRILLGEYAYLWEKRELRRIADEQPVPLPEAEKLLLEELILARPLGETALLVSPAQALDADLLSLRKRLGVEIKVQLLLLDKSGVPLWGVAVISLVMLLLGSGGTLLFIRRRRIRRRSHASVIGPP